jgi:hypothetical protein
MRRECPQWFQDRLTRVGGTNKYGEPKFKLVWGESETMRDGGYFQRDGYLGYRDVLSLGGEATWALMMWEPAEKFGTPYRWYKDNTDEHTGLVTLGQYPHRGRYRVIRKLIHRELVDGEWLTARMEPTHFILDVMVPLIEGWNRISDAERLQIIKEEQAKEEAEADRVLADAMDGVRIRRSSPLVQKRLEQMEKNMARAMAIASRTQRGMIQTGA